MVPASRIAPELPAAAEIAPGGQAAFLHRAEVRDVLAWVRLLVDPHDAAAVVRALARPPIELRQAHLARVIALARRRKLDLVAGLTAATESPQVPPEARERIERFASLHRSAIVALDALAPDAFLLELIELIGMPGRALLTVDDAAEQRASLQGLRDLADELVRAESPSSSRELARRLAAVVPEARGAIAAGSDEPPAQLAAIVPDGEPSTDELLQARFKRLHEEVLDSVARVGGRLGELRLDTELDVSHGVVRYLELLKLAALMQRPAGQELAEALADVNGRLLAAATPLQREIFQTSALDDSLIGGARLGLREEHSLEPFLPRKGAGLALSASDIETYRSCPLRYKFARVLRIPTEQTLHQRFGIAVHQVLERFHAGGEETLERINELLDAGWRRAGFGDSEIERGLHEKARTALASYHARLRREDRQPVWFERSFSFRLGPHHLRGRVDRVDRLGAGDDAEYELIDYKTSRPKSAEELEDDVQLSLYALAAREDWQLPSSRQAYYYVLDDVKVPVPRDGRDAAAVSEIVMRVGEGILAQEFEPTPSHAACSLCDYRIVCPVAER
ncbi:MAG: ATP-dependent helicase [Solirubrobacterales bacterium]|nr:ATP-dependent helicase [Solirubrobacterales bacterium]